MNAFNWLCPFCKTHSVATPERVTQNKFDFHDDNRFGPLSLQTTAITCANPSCKEVTLTSSLYPRKVTGSGTVYGTKISSWNLRPDSLSKIFPDYIPAPILNDYYEACKIRDLSPKASATLARRALQGMIRDFWGVTEKRNLFEEIDAIKEKVDDLVWQAIDSLRKCGNIGAHMEKDINIIVDVDPTEASSLIELIEMLIEEWYIARQTRRDRLNKVVAISATKENQRKSNTQ